MADTIFEKIASGEIAADRVYEDEHVVAFRDISPQAPVHVLVIPRVKMKSLIDVPAADSAIVGAFLQGVAKAAAALGLQENGYRVVFNTGRDALQTVPYLHAHILAGRRMGWPPG